MADEIINPSLRDMLGLEFPLGLRLSPDGSRLAYQVRSTDWKRNRYDYHMFVHEVAAGRTARLTRNGSSGDFEWLDNHTLAVILKPEDQVFVFEQLIGEGWQVTDQKGGVRRFWPFAGGILYLADDPKRDEDKPRKQRFGTFTHFEQERSSSALYYLDLDALRVYEAALRASDDDEAKKLVRPVVDLSPLLPEPLMIESVRPERSGKRIYLNCRAREDLVYLTETRAFRIDLDPEAALQAHVEKEQAGEGKDDKDEKKEKEDFTHLGTLVELPLPENARISAVAPDGAELLVNYAGQDKRMFKREDMWLLPVSALEGEPEEDAVLVAMRNLSASLDRSVYHAVWTQAGIFTRYIDSTHMQLARLSPDNPPQVLEIDGPSPYYLYDQYHLTDGGDLAYVGADEHSFPEVFLGQVDSTGVQAARCLTEFGRQVEGWASGSRETLRWSSRDGTEIEGVLYKPADFDPNKKYPLVFVVHGGPRWFSGAYLVSTDDLGYYPAFQFLQKGVLVLKPNYRGSEGRGQDFMALNVNNLGVGDLWDLESAIDYLAELGMVNPDAVGCMGWSQGGYISAFAGLHSERFAAVSVGAGISDWYTYHISNDIPAFTTDYLSASPFRDRTIYEKTAPMANLDGARTPMLIQHGEDDRRVPVSNALELYRGLKEMGVPVELFLYPGMGHPITRPRQNHAVLHQNLNWFSHYLLEEPLDLLGEAGEEGEEGEKEKMEEKGQEESQG